LIVFPNISLVVLFKFTPKHIKINTLPFYQRTNVLFFLTALQYSVKIILENREKDFYSMEQAVNCCFGPRNVNDAIPELHKIDYVWLQKPGVA